MSPDCAVLGRAPRRRATPAGGGWMALFFRGETRKFFLILLGGCRSEKNCAGFGRELREFSRGVVGGGWEWIGIGGRLLRNGGDEPDAGHGRGGGRSRPARQGFGRETGACSPMECTAFGLVAGSGCPQCRGCRPIGSSRSPFDRTGFRVASDARCPHLNRSAAQADSDAHRRNPQRDESIPAGDIHTAAFLRRRCDVRPHLPDAQGRESIRRQDIHMSVRPWCKPLGSRMRQPVRV